MTSIVPGPEDHQGNSSPNGSFRSTALNLSRIFWENDLSWASDSNPARIKSVGRKARTLITDAS